MIAVPAPDVVDPKIVSGTRPATQSALLRTNTTSRVTVQVPVEVGAEPKMPTSDLEGFIEDSVGNYGRKTMGGAVTVPLVKDKVLLHVEGYETHAGAR
jgi:hypothetical protein